MFEEIIPHFEEIIFPPAGNQPSKREILCKTTLGVLPLVIKPLTIPPSILVAEALLRRLPKNHPKYTLIGSDLAKRWAGYHGEKSIQYPLSFLKDDFLIFYGLRLPHGDYHFQIDTLILSPFFVLLLEIKHISGTLFFDHSFDQLVQTYNEKERSLPNPILQGKRHHAQFKSWLKENKLPILPIEHLAVSTNQYSVLKADPRNTLVFKHICTSEKLTEKIEEMANKYQEPKILPKEVKKISRTLLKSHTPFWPDLLKTYGISKEELTTGILCPNCRTSKMRCIHGFWLCPSCGQRGKDAHIQSLADYFLLFRPSINNSQFRIFSGISNVKSASSFLRRSGLPSAGTTKSRTYFPPADLENWILHTYTIFNK